MNRSLACSDKQHIRLIVPQIYRACLTVTVFRNDTFGEGGVLRVLVVVIVSLEVGFELSKAHANPSVSQPEDQYVAQPVHV